jgi:neutral ceramidase
MRLLVWTAGLALFTLCGQSRARGADLAVGAAAVVLEADDSMPTAGGIGPGQARGQEGKLRVVAIVLEKPGRAKVAIVACDVLFVPRSLVDPALAEIEKTMHIPASYVLVNATHTHHAPSLTRIHGVEVSEVFAKRVGQGIVEAVQKANATLHAGAEFVFHLGEETTVGQNSRLLLADSTIFWIGPRDDAVRPTGPFDPELPVLAFRDSAGKLLAATFNHSTHTIGTRTPGVRSPSFYGLAAQELEAETGATMQFLEGASGSTHNLSLSTPELIERIKLSVKDSLAKVRPREVNRLKAIKRPFKFKVRSFDERTEADKVERYVRKRAPQGADAIIKVFSEMRKELSPLQGQERETWLQVMLVGDVAVVGVPAEFFTGLGLEIKKRSPLEDTFVAELANDWIGYLPDREAHQLGGYQTWMGLHSYAEPGTGERIVEEVTKMLVEINQP